MQILSDVTYNQRKLSSLLSADIETALGKTISVEPQLNEFFKNFIIKPNSKNLKAVSLEPEQQLEKIRLLVMSSDYEDALSVINEIENSNESNSTLLAELFFERSRIMSFQGHWEKAIEACNACLDFEPISVTQLSIYQIRSVALFEIGQFELAYKDILQVEKISKFYPFAVAARLAKSHKVKILSRLQNVEAATQALKNLWLEELNSKPLNLFYLIVLGRVQIELARLNNKSYLQWAIFCLNLSRHIDNKLYAGLALIDLQYSLNTDGQALIAEQLKSACDKLERVQKLLFDIQQNMPRYTMARTIKFTSNQKHPKNDLILDKVDVILISEVKSLIDLRSGSCFEEEKIQSTDVILKSLIAISKGETTRKLFFERVWQQKYVPDLHDVIIKQNIHRLRIKYNLDIKCYKSLIILSTKVLVV